MTSLLRSLWPPWKFPKALLLFSHRTALTLERSKPWHWEVVSETSCANRAKPWGRPKGHCLEPGITAKLVWNTWNNNQKRIPLNICRVLSPIHWRSLHRLYKLALIFVKSWNKVAKHFWPDLYYFKRGPDHISLGIKTLGAQNTSMSQVADYDCHCKWEIFAMDPLEVPIQEHLPVLASTCRTAIWIFRLGHKMPLACPS